MCEPVSIALAVMGVAGAASGAHAQAKAEGAAEDTKRSQQIEMIRQMNSASADINLEAVDKYDQAQQQLTEINLSTIRNKGMLAAAIGESNIAGNSMDRLKRVTAAEQGREKIGVMDNYERDYQTLFANKIGNVENTKGALKGMAPVLKTSKLAHALNIVSGGVNGYAQGQSLKGSSSSSNKKSD